MDVSYDGEPTSAFERYRATVTARPTLLSKYSTALAEMSSAFSWKPNGVSSRTAGTGGGPSRSKIDLCVVTMVGLVSPEPMITKSRAVTMGGRPSREVPVGDRTMQQVGQLPGML